MWRDGIRYISNIKVHTLFCTCGEKEKDIFLVYSNMTMSVVKDTDERDDVYWLHFYFLYYREQPVDSLFVIDLYFIYYRE